MIKLILLFVLWSHVSLASDEVTCDSLVYQAILQEAGAFEGPNSYINYQVLFDRPWADRLNLTYQVSFTYLDDDGFAGQLNYEVQTTWSSRFGAVYMCRSNIPITLEFSGFVEL